jgi:hypothetical protein
MQSDRYSNSKTATATCLWCSEEYVMGASRAADQQMFCGRKCEMEARFWLYELLKKVNLEAK